MARKKGSGKMAGMTQISISLPQELVKQIDEMARILTLCPRNTCVGCGMECIDYRMAKTLYNAGYRKIPENAVCLTKKCLKE